MKNILVTGASGMLGATLVNELKNDFEVFASGSSNFKSQYSQYMKFDLKSDSFNELINWSNPDIIIHCAAITNGNYCKENPKEAFDVNGFSIYKFLESTKSSVKFIYISSDAVFPSSLHLANEKDCVNPGNIYGKSKELGEFFLINSERDFLIIRTTIVGINRNKDKKGFVEWIIDSSKSNETISLFDDVTFNPISIWDFSEELRYLINENKINAEILHIAGKEIVTKYEFGIRLLDKFKLSNDNILKGSIKSFKERAKRSNNQTLDCSFYEKKFNRQLPNLNQTILTIHSKDYEKRH
jgi:dTDP-4-dehydrorhamnose reductase